MGLSHLTAALDASALPVPNASFEETSPSGPVGWRFSGSAGALAGAWTSDQPLAGGRALRMDGRHGSQGWESAWIPARPDQQYLLRWQTRFLGERSWRFRAGFCGAEIIFRDMRGGRMLGSARLHTSCWQTPGWRPGWFLFRTPPTTEAVALRFALETPEPLPGGFDVDMVELDEWPPVASAGGTDLRLLALRIEDEGGRPVAARIRIANRAGVCVRPPGAIVYEHNGMAFHPLEEGACHAFVPGGRYSITVTRGFEYEPWEGEVEVTEGRHDYTIRLRRLWDWRQRGWFCGDHHTHLHRHGGSLFPTLGWRDALRAARSEGLDFLPFMGLDRYPSEPEQGETRSSGCGFICELSEEVTEDFWGHVCPIGASPKSRQDPRFKAGPMNLDRYAAIAGVGGALCYGHPHGSLGDGDDLEAVARLDLGHVAREFPVDLALGIPCAIDLLTMEGGRNQLGRKLRDLHRLWNLGLRPVVTASTDFHVDQGRQPIGAVRTYVRSVGLDMPAVARAYRAGHTFATSGPLLDLRVAGAGPGEEVRLSRRGERVQVEVEAVSIGQLDRVEIVVNGQVFQAFTSAQPHRLTGACQVSAERSLWIAARAYGREDRHLASQLEGRPLGAGQFAQTTPVYVLVEGRPIFAAETADADYFVRWCDAVLAGWARHVAGGPERKRHEAIVTERVAHARKVFADLARHGR